MWLAIVVSCSLAALGVDAGGYYRGHPPAMHHRPATHYQPTTHYRPATHHKPDPFASYMQFMMMQQLMKNEGGEDTTSQLLPMMMMGGMDPRLLYLMQMQKKDSKTFNPFGRLEANPTPDFAAVAKDAAGWANPFEFKIPNPFEIKIPGASPLNPYGDPNGPFGGYEPPKYGAQVYGMHGGYGAPPAPGYGAPLAPGYGAPTAATASKSADQVKSEDEEDEEDGDEEEEEAEEVEVEVEVEDEDVA